MNALRGAALFLLQLVATPVFALLMVLATPFGGARVFALAQRWCALMVQGARLLGMRYQVEFEGNGMPAGPAVILAKHSSSWETFYIVAYFPRLVPVIKRELLRMPFFGWGIGLCQPIALDRSSPREARNELQEQGIDRLKQGLWVMIFPEGTRIPFGYRGRYASGGAGLAIAAGVPVVAMAHDAGHFWRKPVFDKSGGIIRVRISAPMFAAASESAAGLSRRAEEWIERQIEDFGYPPAEATAKPRARAGDTSAPGANRPTKAPQDAG